MRCLRLLLAQNDRIAEEHSCSTINAIPLWMCIFVLR